MPTTVPSGSAAVGARHDAYYLGALRWAPTWPFNADDCTIWERRGGRGRHAPAAGFVVPAPVDCT